MSTSTPGSSRRSRKKEPAENNTSGDTDMPDWAKDLVGLWSNEDPNLDAEIRYNTKVSLIPPYCAICSLFAQAADRKPDPKVIKKPRYSKPLISDKMFSSNAGRLSSAGFTPAIDVEGRSPLVTCVSCAVCVHASCYGLQYDEDYSQWKCSKCAQKQCTASCWLCHLRGGALKRTTTGYWCHIVCALAVPEVAFESVVHRSPISVTRVPAGRMKMKCEFCYAWTGGSGANGVCIQCCDGVCTTAFHVSCAQAYGIRFAPAEWPFPVDVICHKHTDNKENSKKKSAKESFPVAKLTPRKSVSAGPRSSSYSPVRQLRRSGSAASIPDVAEQNDESANEKASVNNLNKVLGKLPASDKSKHPIVCLKFLSDTEVKRLSSPSSSPMAKAKDEEEPLRLEEMKSPVARRRMGPLSKVHGKKRQPSAERSQSQTATPKSDLNVPQEIAATSSSSLPGLTPSTPTSSTVLSPKLNTKLPKTGKKSMKSPERKLKAKINNDTKAVNDASQEKKVLGTPKSDGSQEKANVTVSSKTTENAPKKISSNNQGTKDDVKIKTKKRVPKGTEASQTPKVLNTSNQKSMSITPDATNNMNMPNKSPMSPKPEKIATNPMKGDAQTNKRMTSPKRPNKSPKPSPVKTSPKLNSNVSVKSSPKSNASSPMKTTAKSSSAKSSPVKSSPKKAALSKTETAKVKNTSSPAVIKRILSDTAVTKQQKAEQIDNKPTSCGSVISQSNAFELSCVSTSSPATASSVIDSRLRTLSNNLIPLSATQPLACSTPVQDLSDSAKDQQSPVTSRSRSGRAIKISSVAREAFMDTTEENNFGFLMGCQSGEASPDPTKSKSFSDELKEADAPAKKLHWKTLQKMERLRLEQEGDGAKGLPIYVPKTTLPKLPHNSEHIQAVIDMVVENARRSVDKDEKLNGKGNVSKYVQESSTSIETQENHISDSNTAKVSDFKIAQAMPSSLGKQNDDTITRENGFVASAKCASPPAINTNPTSSFSGENKAGLNEKLTDLIAKMATRVKQLAPEDVIPSSSSTETTPNKSFVSASSSSKITDEGSSESEDSSDSEDNSASASSPEKSVCSRSRSPRFNAAEDTASTSTQGIDWFKGEVQIDGLEDDNNNESVSKLEDNLEELESSRDSFDYINSISNAANADSAEEPEVNAELALTKVEENNRILSSTENPNSDDSKKNAFFSAELEKYLLNVSPVKQGEFLGSKATKGKVEFKKGMNNGWKNSMDPDIDEVEGVMFFSFSCKEALETHVKKEKSSSGIPRQVSSSLAKYHAKIQQDAAVSGMGLYPRGSCKSLVKHLTGTQLETLSLDLPRQACRYPDFSRESEWRQVNRGTYDAVEEDFCDVVDNTVIDELTSEGTSSFDVNVTRIYGRKSDGTFARKKMALPRLKRLGPAQPVNIEEPPGLDKYESQSKEWGIVTTQIIQQRARELKQEGFTFPRKKPLVSYQPVTVTSSMALAAATALQLVPTTPREPTDTACKRPGCRYGCVCHLCESVVEDDEEGTQSDHNSTQSHNCPKQYCRLGCICDSIDDNASSPRTPTHCGKPSCMFECICENKIKEETVEVKEEKKDDVLEPGEVRITKVPHNEGVVKITIGPTLDKEKVIAKTSGAKDPATQNNGAAPSRGRGRGMGRGRGSGRGRGGVRNPQIKPKINQAPAEPCGSDDSAVRKSSRLKNKPLIGIGNIDRLNSLVFFDTVAWLAEGDGPRKRKKIKENEANSLTAEHQGSESMRRSSTGSKGRERIGSNSSNSAEKLLQVKHQQMEDGDAEDEDSDDAMDNSTIDEDGPSTCARMFAFKPKKRRRLSEKSIKSEIKEEITDNKSPVESPEPKSIKIKAEKISPIAKNLSPAARQFAEGGGDYVHPLMGKFKTQMVLLQRKRTEQTNLESISQDTPYLLEIQSNCDWEGIRSQLLSKISTEMNQISVNAQYEYPNLTSFKIGAFIADILPRPEKATTIPPNLQRILGTIDMYPIRIRIIHSSCQLGKREEALGVSPVSKQVDSQPLESSASPIPEVVPSKRPKIDAAESAAATPNVKKTSAKRAEKSDNTKKVEKDIKKEPKKEKNVENSSSFVGLSGLSRLNLKIDGPAGPSMSLLSSSPLNSCELRNFNIQGNHTPRYRNPHRTPTPPGISDSNGTGKKSAKHKIKDKSNGPESNSKDKVEEQAKTSEKAESYPIGQVMFIPVTSTNSVNCTVMNLVPGGEISDANLSNNFASNASNLINLSGGSPKLQAAPSTLPAMPPNQETTATPVTTGTSDNLPLPVKDLNTSAIGEKGPGNSVSSNQPDSKLSNVNDGIAKTTEHYQMKSVTAQDQVKYVPAGFLVVPNPNAVSTPQGNFTLSVKALVVGPHNVVATTRLSAGTSLKSLPSSFRLSPVVKNMNIPVKCSDVKTFLPKSPTVVNDVGERNPVLKSVIEQGASPAAKVSQGAGAALVSDISTQKRRVSVDSAVTSTTDCEKPNAQSSENSEVKVSQIKGGSKSQGAVPITVNCSIRSGSVKYTEGGPEDIITSDRRLTPDLDKSDEVDDDLLSIDEDESDSVDVESGDGDNILLALRNQQVKDALSSNLKQVQCGSQDKDYRKKNNSYRELSTHCSRLESSPTSAATTTEKKALERRRRFQICKLFKKLQRVYEGMCNVTVSTGVPVPKFRLLQFAITTISMFEEKKKKLTEVRLLEVKRRFHLVKKLRDLHKDAGRPFTLPSGVTEVIAPFQHETWFENRAKKAAKESEREKVEEEEHGDDKPAAFHFRPIEEVVSETSAGKATNSNNGQGKKSRKKSIDRVEKTQASTFKKNIPKISHASRGANSKPQVYMDYDDGCLYGLKDVGSLEREDKPSNNYGSGDAVKHQIDNSLEIDNPVKTVTENSSLKSDEVSKANETTCGESHQVGDEIQVAHKRKLSRSDEDSPSAKESKLQGLPCTVVEHQ